MTPGSEKARGNLVTTYLLMQKEVALNKTTDTLFPCTLKPLSELVRRLVLAGQKKPLVPNPACVPRQHHLWLID